MTPEPPLPPLPRIDRQPTASPARPSLVNKRVHGPHMVGFNLSVANRARWKTVSFDECCDIVESYCEEHKLEDEEEDGYHTPRDGEDDGPYTQADPCIWSSPSSSPAVPPVNRLSPSTSVSTGSGLPLGRSTHPERPAISYGRDEVNKEVQMLPPSPSPSKVSAKVGSRYQEGLIPSFDPPVPRRKCEPNIGHTFRSLIQASSSDTTHLMSLPSRKTTRNYLLHLTDCAR
jgi:hypothetical protein